MLNVFLTYRDTVHSPATIFVSHSHMHVVWERIVTLERNRFWLIYISSALLNTMKLFLKYHLSVLSVCENVPSLSLALDFIHHRSFPGEYEHSISKNMESSSGPKRKRTIFSKTVSVWLNFRNVWGSSP
jgi:hypothetical protein